MVRVYATPGDLPADLAGLPDVQDRIVEASLVVAELTRSAVYQTTSDGHPADRDVAETFKQATIMQVAWSDEVTGGAGDYTNTPSQLGSLKFDATGPATTGAPEKVNPNVVRLLKLEGLINPTVGGAK